MILYHTTDAAGAILRDGFHDGEGTYGIVGLTLRGVFLAAYPVDINEGAFGDQVLRVDLSDDVDMSTYAIEEEGMAVWEWCVPADVLNRSASVRLLSDDEAGEAYVPPYER